MTTSTCGTRRIPTPAAQRSTSSGLVASQGAEPIVVGFDVAVLDDDGKISSVSGFLDEMPDGA